MKELNYIKIDQETLNLLRKTDLSLEFIPKKDQVVILKETANATKGGIVKNVTLIVHDDYKKIAEKAVKAVDLKFAGVDILCKYISKSTSCEKGYVLEINFAPGIDMHQYPTIGKSDNVGKMIVDMMEKYCFKKSI